MTHTTANALAAGLRVAFGSRRKGASTWFHGDSITHILSTPETFVFGESHATLLPMLSGGRVLMAGNSGVVNDTVQMAAARIGTVVAAKPARCVILLGTNNTNLVPGDPLPDAMLAYERDIVNVLLIAGIEPVVCTIPPRSGTRTADAPTYRNTLRWNAWVRALADRRGLGLIDYYAAVVDPTTGDYKTGLSDDGIHPNGLGGTVMATYAAARLTGIYDAPSPVPFVRDRYSSIEIAQDPLILGALTSGTGGMWPTGWNGPGTGVTVSAVAPTAGDGLDAGNWLQFDKTAAGTSVNINHIRTVASLASTAAGPVAAGDRIQWAFRYALDNLTGGAYVTVDLRHRDGGGANLLRVTPASQIKQPHTGVIYAETVVPAGTVDLRLDLSFSAAGTGRLRVGQVTVRDLTALGLPPLLTTP